MTDWYQNIETKERVKITEDSDQFYTLNNGSRISKLAFAKKYAIVNTPTPQNNLNEEVNPASFFGGEPVMQTINRSPVNEAAATVTRYVTDNVIDPSSFFNNDSVQGMSSFANQLKNFDTSSMGAAPSMRSGNVPVISGVEGSPANQGILNSTGINPSRIDGDIVKLSTVDDEKRRIMEKYNVQPLVAPQSQQVHQDVIPLVDPTMVQPEASHVSITPQNRFTEQSSDPSYNFFKSAKKSHKMTVNLSIDFNISNPDFIRMMADNMEGDFIKHYTNDFMRMLLDDTDGISDKVYEQIKTEVYGNKRGKKESPVKKEPKQSKQSKDKKVEPVPTPETKPTKRGKPGRKATVKIQPVADAKTED